MVLILSSGAGGVCGSRAVGHSPLLFCCCWRWRAILRLRGCEDSRFGSGVDVDEDDSATCIRRLLVMGIVETVASLSLPLVSGFWFVLELAIPELERSVRVGLGGCCFSAGCCSWVFGEPLPDWLDVDTDEVTSGLLLAGDRRRSRSRKTGLFLLVESVLDEAVTESMFPSDVVGSDWTGFWLFSEGREALVEETDVGEELGSFGRACEIILGSLGLSNNALISPALSAEDGCETM